MAIRKATLQDLDDLLRVYASARTYMAQTGNPTQWGATYPTREMLEEDIRQGTCYLYEDDGIHGAFILALGEDPSYQTIEDGAWLNDRPYGTMHKVASDGTRAGLFSQYLAFCKGIIPNLRIDTHHDNRVMQQVVERHGFQRCGVIYFIGDGTPRLAYQLSDS